MAGSEAFENPLIPNARLKQMFLAMARARLLDDAISSRARTSTRGLEACLVAPAVDLSANDLVSDALTGPVVHFLRGTPLHRALHPEKRSRKAAVHAEAGSAIGLPGAAGIEQRLWAAAGAASALRAAHRAAGSSDKHRGIVLTYLPVQGVAPGLLRSIFQFAVAEQLPMLFLALPSKSTGRNSTSINALAHRCGLPGMAVDCDDAVAIYRVAQESLGRARIGGGPALIECVRFVLHGGSASRQTADAVSNIERYLLERHVATSDWIARETRAFARHLAKPLH